MTSKPIYVGEEDDETEAAYDLVDDAGINLHRLYRDFYVIKDGDKVVAALAMAAIGPTLEFSVAVDKGYQRKGLAKQLIQHAIKHAAQEPFVKTVEAHVVNPILLPVLRGLGFERNPTVTSIWQYALDKPTTATLNGEVHGGRVEAARKFFTRKWKQEKGRRSLTGACVFAVAFARRLFGGQVRGNWHHVYLEVDGQRVDLTGGVGVRKQALERLAKKAEYESEGLDDLARAMTPPGFVGPNVDIHMNDPSFLKSKEFKEVWASVQPRARRWAKEFAQANPDMEGVLKAAYLSVEEALELLDVDYGASAPELKRAFRKAAKAAHPDAGGSTSAMQDVNEAYKTLQKEQRAGWPSQPDAPEDVPKPSRRPTPPPTPPKPASKPAPKAQPKTSPKPSRKPAAPVPKPGVTDVALAVGVGGYLLSRSIRKRWARSRVRLENFVEAAVANSESWLTKPAEEMTDDDQRALLQAYWQLTNMSANELARWSIDPRVPNAVQGPKRAAWERWRVKKLARLRSSIRRSAEVYLTSSDVGLLQRVVQRARVLRAVRWPVDYILWVNLRNLGIDWSRLRAKKLPLRVRLDAALARAVGIFQRQARAENPTQ